MSVGSSTSACRIKRRARTTLRPASLSPRSKIFRTTCAEIETADAYAGTHENPAAKVSLKETKRRGKKEFAGKRHKKKTSIGRTIPCALALFGDCVPYEARATKHSTADVAYETATGRAPSCVSRNRRTQVSRVATRDSLLFAKSKKKSAVVDERARDLRSTPHRSARASGGDARVDPTTRARAPRVAAKAGTGWPSTRGRASRDTILGRADACLRVFF